eukprot:jgi/Chrzof1/10637/Cz05g06070.t1
MEADLQYEATADDMAGDAMEDEEEQPRIKSTVHVANKKKGRGFRDPGRSGKEEPLSNARFESLEPTGGSGPAKSVEGWVLFVTGLHEEAQEEDVAEAFAEHGDVKNVYLNLDRQTGYVKGYALVEYAEEKEAREAIKSLDSVELLGQTIHVTWAFSKGPGRGARRGRQ